MTSFASVFSSSDQNEISSNETGMSVNSKLDNQHELVHFSSVDLDHVSPSTGHSNSSFSHPSDRLAFPTDAQATTDALSSDSPPVLTGENRFRRSFASSTMSSRSSNPTDRRISIPDMSRLSTSSAAVIAAVGPTLDKFKQWSRSRYKCTKQSIFEKLGKTTRTVDVELEAQIEQIRETKRRYESILALARSYANHFVHLMSTQRALSDQCFELQQKSSLLSDEFGHNAETQRILVCNGEILLNALNYFISTLQTLCTKTIEDTVNSIHAYETARLEYDACRTELELFSPGLEANLKQHQFEKYKENYEKLKHEVTIKLQLLDDNQVKVMKNQLLLFHNAIAAYFSGNKQALDATMKAFHLKNNPLSSRLLIFYALLFQVK